MDENQLEQPTFEPEEKSDNQDEGSNLGKFKNAKTLLDAYHSLQAEFTRKSQMLAEFQKKNQENAVFEQKHNEDSSLDNVTDNDEYKKEITEILAKDSYLSSLPNKYQVALKIIEESNRKSAEQVNNPNFIDKYINDNIQLKNKIINDYLSTLNNISSTPKIISGNAPNIVFTPNESKPKTLKDAGEIFSKMLK